MESIEIKGKSRNSTLLIGEKFENIGKYLPRKPIYIITDSNILKFYEKDFPNGKCYIIKPGEESKNLSRIEDIYHWMLDNEADRGCFVLGIGGGVVCDIAGFVATTYMRGVEFGFASTSLLSQVDASVGGKNGVNLYGYKNIIGTFSQPRFVLCDTQMLRTLPREELSNGFAEMVKHAIISSKELFGELENDCKSLLSLTEPQATWHITESVKVKARIVESDERESGLRKLLNFGHTWGHAVEKSTGMPHGKAVSIGMEMACRLSMKKGFISSDTYLRITNLLKSFGLPVRTNLNSKTVYEAMLKDKKRNSNSIDFILIKDIGSPVIEKISIAELQQLTLKND